MLVYELSLFTIQRYKQNNRIDYIFHNAKLTNALGPFESTAGGDPHSIA